MILGVHCFVGSRNKLGDTTGQILIAWNSNPRYLYGGTRSTSLPLNVKV